jgi:hypothetical protein
VNIDNTGSHNGMAIGNYGAATNDDLLGAGTPLTGAQNT